MGGEGEFSAFGLRSWKPRSDRANRVRGAGRGPNGKAGPQKEQPGFLDLPAPSAGSALPGRLHVARSLLPAGKFLPHGVRVVAGKFQAHFGKSASPLPPSAIKGPYSLTFFQVEGRGEGKNRVGGIPLNLFLGCFPFFFVVFGPFLLAFLTLGAEGKHFSPF